MQGGAFGSRAQDDRGRHHILGHLGGRDRGKGGGSRARIPDLDRKVINARPNFLIKSIDTHLFPIVRSEAFENCTTEPTYFATRIPLNGTRTAAADFGIAWMW